MGNKFEIDGETIFTLTEQEIEYTPVYNHISKFKKYKDIYDAWKALLSHYEYHQYNVLIRTS